MLRWTRRWGRDMETKLCKKCGVTKPTNAFGFKKYKLKNGEVSVYTRTYCAPCRYASEYSTDEQRQRRNEQAAISRRNRISRMTEEELNAFKVKQTKATSIWIKDNPEKKKEYRKRYAEKYKEVIKLKKARDASTPHGKVLDRARCRKYFIKHSERINAINKKRRNELDRGYVVSLLTRGKSSSKAIPEELIEAKRVVTLIKRELKDISK